MDVAIIGAGNGGRASAAHLSLLGHRVALTDRFPAQLQDVARTGRLTISGSINGVASIDLVTDDLGSALERSRVVLVTVPAFALEWVATATADHLRPDHIVVLHPGGTVGALVVRSIWDRLGRASGTVLATTESLVYACRLTSHGDPDVRAVKRRLLMAALPAAGNAAAHAIMLDLYPQTTLAADVLAVGVANLNPVIHPPISIVNAARIDAGDAFDFYGEGVTASAGRWIDALDRERVELARKLDVETESLGGWVNAAYAVTGDDTPAILQRMALEIYRGIRSPAKLDSRYLTEDVPFGLVPMIRLGQALGLEMRAMSATVRIASTLLARELESEGYGLEAIGINDPSPAGIRARVA